MLVLSIPAVFGFSSATRYFLLKHLICGPYWWYRYPKCQVQHALQMYLRHRQPEGMRTKRGKCRDTHTDHRSFWPHLCTKNCLHLALGLVLSLILKTDKMGKHDAQRDWFINLKTTMHLVLAFSSSVWLFNSLQMWSWWIGITYQRYIDTRPLIPFCRAIWRIWVFPEHHSFQKLFQLKVVSSSRKPKHLSREFQGYVDLGWQFSWNSMIFNDVPSWFIMVYNASSCFIVFYHVLSWFLFYHPMLLYAKETFQNMVSPTPDLPAPGSVRTAAGLSYLSGGTQWFLEAWLSSWLTPTKAVPTLNGKAELGGGPYPWRWAISPFHEDQFFSRKNLFCCCGHDQENRFWRLKVYACTFICI